MNRDYKDIYNETIEFQQWKKKNGYIAYHYFSGGSLLTIVRKSHWEKLTLENCPFWRIVFSYGDASFYIRVLSLELTWTFPLWLTKLIRRK